LLSIINICFNIPKYNVYLEKYLSENKSLIEEIENAPTKVNVNVFPIIKEIIKPDYPHITSKTKEMISDIYFNKIHNEGIIINTDDVLIKSAV
jgi:hypothetical protein